MKRPYLKRIIGPPSARLVLFGLSQVFVSSTFVPAPVDGWLMLFCAAWFVGSLFLIPFAIFTCLVWWQRGDSHEQPEARSAFLGWSLAGLLLLIPFLCAYWRA